MKTIQCVFTACLTILVSLASAQISTESSEVNSICETTFVTLGTHLNSNYGLAGLDVDFKLIDKVQGSVSGGLGSW